MPLTPQMRRRLNEVRDGLIEAEQARNDAIAEAWRRGGSIREIALEVGLSHVWVSKLLERMGVRKRLTGEQFDEYRGRW